jgi:hypothetical protein
MSMEPIITHRSRGHPCDLVDTRGEFEYQGCMESQKEKPTFDPAEPGPDSAKSPIKQPDLQSDPAPEIPKVGTADAPGG